VKWAMYRMGLLEPVYRLPMVPPSGQPGRRSNRCSTAVGLAVPIGEPIVASSAIEDLFDNKPEQYTPEHFALFARFKQALNAGKIRAAEPDAAQASGWRVNGWVKKGILLGFRIGSIVDMSIDPARQPFLDKSTYPVRAFTPADGVRIVPGGSSIRDGCYIGKGVTCMPPMYINAGAYVGDGTMIDSHALVGSCAQVGATATSRPRRRSAECWSRWARCR
jgi:2,3,4,5-tetrahydropyridine-2,6-dicarboxylate N-succinyltransferase